MKCVSRKAVYTAVELLFVLSFGYFIALHLMYLLKNIGIGILPQGFYNSDCEAFLHMLFFEEVSVVFCLLFFGFSIILSVLIIIGCRRYFRLRNLIFTAAAPLTLIAVHTIVKAVDALLEQYSSFQSYIREEITMTVALALLVGYAIGFFGILHRERRQIPCAE